MEYQKTKELLRYCIQGWVFYFKLADMSGKLKRIDEWLRFRIRMFIWKSWKKISTKYNNLRKVGVKDNQAY